MKETQSGYHVQYSDSIKVVQYGLVEQPIDIQQIKTEFDQKLYDKLIRAMSSKRENEKRDKKIHMVNVAQLVER